MVVGSRIEGGTQILSARVRNTIQSIKEVVGNHSDTEIYVTLKETNMDPNETAQKLLNQDTFHEVRRKRDKKKENPGYKGLTEARKPREHEGQGMKFYTSDRGVRRGGYNHNALNGGSREFRVVSDNRNILNGNREMKPPLSQSSASTSEQVSSHVSEKGSLGTSNNQKSPGGRYSSQASIKPIISHPRQSQDTNSSGPIGKESREVRRAVVPNAITQVQASKPNDSQPQTAMLAANHSVVGVYSSSSDPVHVPSPDSRSAAAVGAIKREFGAVGVRHRSSETTVKPSSAHSSSFSHSHLGKDGTSSRESLRPSTSKSDQSSQTTLPESIVPSRSFLSNQYNGRLHQQVVGHQKASQPNKEWKPKSSKTSSLNGPGVIGTPAKSVSNPPDNSKGLEIDGAQVQEKLSRVNNFENQNVIIAEHIRVTESDRCRLTFGSFGTEFDSFRNVVSESHAVGNTENSSAEPFTSLSASTPESSGDETSASKHVDLLDDQVRNSGSNSPASGAVSEHLLPDKKVSSSPQNLDTYADIGLVHTKSPSYNPSESQEEQDPPELPSFSAYDPQTGYDIPYFRPTMDETFRGQGLLSPQEALGSHTANSIPASTIAMVQQQQPPMAQMYPQVHVSHYANLMPYRQFLSPVYVPPMPIPGYSSNSTYPHPSNGSSYVLMPGSNSHLTANNLKYGIQQFKPVPAGSPTGFGNFTGPTGYAINAPGGSAAGHEDPSRLKYKEGNLYVPNPQTETSEMWVQNPRELPSLQSAAYYNMPGQTPHAAYLPSHTGHASFNAAAAAQSSHMQFPGLYHPPQAAAIPNPHHLGPAMGGNVGVGVAAAAPGAQVGAYQQPQLGHLNWTTNF
ncbi:dentin sialophosphoprotein, putative [Actinidia rufa]|uniref:Dentin sialophosphoprotein, putative n=1 Tax=Actinidia rufa TaxID=165716 RepID=A0A7J0GLQ7_9ERIC|nr:dentin sialophosphoprotein, putative [Actinidia rufa]